MSSVCVPVRQANGFRLHDNTFQRACIVQDIVLPHDLRLLPGIRVESGRGGGHSRVAVRVPDNCDLVVDQAAEAIVYAHTLMAERNHDLHYIPIYII